jgi:hypothetical protein
MPALAGALIARVLGADTSEMTLDKSGQPKSMPNDSGRRWRLTLVGIVAVALGVMAGVRLLLDAGHPAHQRVTTDSLVFLAAVPLCWGALLFLPPVRRWYYERRRSLTEGFVEKLPMTPWMELPPVEWVVEYLTPRYRTRREAWQRDPRFYQRRHSVSAFVAAATILLYTLLR